MYTVHIKWPGLNSYSPMDNLNILLLSLMLGSDAFTLITIGEFHLHNWSKLCIVFAFISAGCQVVSS